MLLAGPDAPRTTMRGSASSRSRRTRCRARTMMDRIITPGRCGTRSRQLSRPGRRERRRDDLEVLGSVGVGQDHEVRRRGARPRSARRPARARRGAASRPGRERSTSQTSEVSWSLTENGHEATGTSVSSMSTNQPASSPHRSARRPRRRAEPVAPDPRRAVVSIELDVIEGPRQSPPRRLVARGRDRVGKVLAGREVANAEP